MISRRRFPISRAPFGIVITDKNSFTGGLTLSVPVFSLSFLTLRTLLKLGAQCLPRKVPTIPGVAIVILITGETGIATTTIGATMTIGVTEMAITTIMAKMVAM